MLLAIPVKSHKYIPEKPKDMGVNPAILNESAGILPTYNWAYKIG